MNNKPVNWIDEYNSYDPVINRNLLETATLYYNRKQSRRTPFYFVKVTKHTNNAPKNQKIKLH